MKFQTNTVLKVVFGMCLLFTVTVVFGQKQATDPEKIVFVYYKGRPHNFIVIPNIGKFKSFKIYRKQATDTSFVQVVEKKKPLLPMRNNITPYAVTWEDDGSSSRAIEYKIYAFSKEGEEICEMKIIWEGDKNSTAN